MRTLARKTCRECKAEKSRTKVYFRKLSPKRSRDGYCHTCRDCERQYNRDYYELKGDIQKPKRQAYYQRMKAQRIEYHKRWMATPHGRALQQAAWRRYARFKRMESSHAADQTTLATSDL